MEKRNKIIYWIATGLLSTLLVLSAAMYFLNTEEIKTVFLALGYHTRIVIPLAILKILAVIAITTSFSKTLKEWAYFGLLVDFVLAAEAHIAIADGDQYAAVAAIALWLVSYSYNRKIQKAA